jgi:hypothetical protein
MKKKIQEIPSVYITDITTNDKFTNFTISYQDKEYQLILKSDSDNLKALQKQIQIESISLDSLINTRFIPDQVKSNSEYLIFRLHQKVGYSSNDHYHFIATKAS